MTTSIGTLPSNTKSLANQLFLTPDGKVYAGKDTYYLVSSESDVLKIGNDISLLNNNANYIVSGTGSNQVRTNSELDIRYNVPTHVKNITSQNISDWGAKLSDISAGTNITIDKTNPQNPVISATASQSPVTLTGDVTGTGTGTIATTIADDSITDDKVQDFTLGLYKLERITNNTWWTNGSLIGYPGSNGQPRAAQRLALQPYFWNDGANLGIYGFTRTTSGIVPNPGGTGTTRFLREDGAWIAPTGGGGGGGDPTNLSLGSRTSTSVTINSSTGTNATIPQATASQAGVLSSTNWSILNSIPQGYLVGRYSSGTGVVQMIQIGSGLSYSGGILTSSGGGGGTFSLRANSNPYLSAATTLSQGSGVTLTQSGSTITISATGGGGGGVDLVTAGSSTVGALRYSGVTKTNGQLYGGTSNPTNSTRLNYDGVLHAYDFVGYGISDIKLKTNLKQIGSALDKLNKISGYSFDWKEDNDNRQGSDYGVIAQEIKNILPNAVIDREGILAISNGNQLTALLIEAVKELNKKVEELSNGLSR